MKILSRDIDEDIVLVSLEKALSGLSLATLSSRGSFNLKISGLLVKTKEKSLVCAITCMFLVQFLHRLGKNVIVMSIENTFLVRRQVMLPGRR
jgi:hypothetical protein